MSYSLANSSPAGDLDAIFGPGGFNAERFIVVETAQGASRIGDLAAILPAGFSVNPPGAVEAERRPLARLVEDCEGAALEAIPIARYLAAPPDAPDPVIENCFELGDKVELVAPSKCRKSFFAIDLALHVAAGRPFLGMEIPRPRSVVYFNLEIKTDWMKRRLIRRMEGYGIDTNDVAARLSIVNARSKGARVREEAEAIVRKAGAELAVVDPRYKLMRPDENENAGEGIAGVLGLMDAIAEVGVAVLMVSHDGKGTAGDRDDRDRGAGSGWAARDFDCRFCLTPHADDPEALSVLSVMARNYPPSQDRTIRFDGDKFTAEDGTAPRKQTTETRKARARTAAAKPDLRPVVPRILKAEGKLLSVAALVAKIQAETGIGERNAYRLIDVCESDGTLKKTPRLQEKNGGKLVGLPEQVEEYMRPRLKI